MQQKKKALEKEPLSCIETRVALARAITVEADYGAGCPAAMPKWL